MHHSRQSGLRLRDQVSVPVREKIDQVGVHVRETTWRTMAVSDTLRLRRQILDAGTIL